MKFVAAEKPISATNKELGELKVEGAEYPQYDSIPEFVQSAGNEETALSWINTQVERESKNAGRTALRIAPKGSNLDELYQKVLGLVKNWTPTAGRGPGKAAKAANFDKLAAAINSGKTPEELMALLESMK